MTRSRRCNYGPCRRRRRLRGTRCSCSCYAAPRMDWATGWNLEANANDLSRPWYNIGCGTELQELKEGEGEGGSSNYHGGRGRGDSRCVTTRGFLSRSSAYDRRRGDPQPPRDRRRHCACLHVCLFFGFRWSMLIVSKA